MSDLESTDWSEIAANNIQPAPAGWPPNSSPNIVYTTGREEMGAIKRDWNRRNAVVTSGGSANAQTLTFTQNPTALVRGQRYAFIAGFPNTGPTTLAVGGLAATAIQVNGAALSGGELKVGLITDVIYDGTNFQLIAGSGVGSGLYLPLTGGLLIGPLSMTSPTPSLDTQLFINKQAGRQNVIWGQTGSSNRWAMVLGTTTAESGVSTGSDWQLLRYNNSGAFIDAPISVARSNGQATFSVAIVNGPSDAALKENVAPLDGALDKVKALQGVSFNMIDTPEKREIGLIAQNVAPVVPEIVQDYVSIDDKGQPKKPMMALDYPKLTALLIEAVKTLTARVEALENRPGPPIEGVPA